ncbi:MAG: glycosyltransferase family 2 protein [Dysgonamonadaceae bacterium]|jgi:glycosyltransferase involved in cell wall biosynthesis|nr:glycosyltransferase family 2 protein [Dysgonamonadaceae bacterium]
MINQDSNLKISVAMATYNGERYLRQQLDSVLGQTHGNFELVVCDDCSTDSTMSILHEYAAKDSRLRYYRNEANIGYRKNFERAINLSLSDYIALCDQDDIWLEDHLDTLLTTIGDKQLSCGKYLYIDEDGNPLVNADGSYADFIMKKYADNDHERLEYLVYNRPFLQGASMLIRKSLVPIIFPLPGTMSHDAWIADICSAKCSFVFADRVITLHRQHSNNATGNKCYVTPNVVTILNEIPDRKTKSGRESRYEQCCELLKRLPDMDKKNRKTIVTAQKFYRRTDRLFFRLLYTPLFLVKIRDGRNRKPRWIWTLLRLAHFWVYYK